MGKRFKISKLYWGE